MLNEVKMICEDCGACEGDKSKIDKNIVLNVRVFLDQCFVLIVKILYVIR